MLKNDELNNELSGKIVFPCDICKEDIIIGNTGVKVISKQTTADDFFGNLDTYHVESICKENEIHVNIVVIDGDKRYRGHKYSAVKTTELFSTKYVGNLRLVLGFGKEFSKVISSTLQGNSIILCGDNPTTNLWANTLQGFFSLIPYTVNKWIISEDELIQRNLSNPPEDFNEMILIDDSLMKIARKELPNFPIVEIRKNKVHGGQEKQYAKNLVSNILRISETQNEALISYVNIQIEWLKRLLDELKADMNEALTETAVCPIGNPSETVFIKALLDLVLTEKVLKDLRARMREEEFEIVVNHLYREVPELEKLVKK